MHCETYWHCSISNSWCSVHVFHLVVLAFWNEFNSTLPFASFLCRCEVAEYIDFSCQNCPHWGRQCTGKAMLDCYWRAYVTCNLLPNEWWAIRHSTDLWWVKMRLYMSLVWVKQISCYCQGHKMVLRSTMHLFNRPPRKKRQITINWEDFFPEIQED